jgi:hypothetical protein
MRRIRGVAVVAVILVALPVCLATADPGGSADLKFVSVTPRTAVVHVGEEVEVRLSYENAGPDAGQCDLTATTPDGGPLFVGYHGSRPVNGNNVTALSCDGDSPGVLAAEDIVDLVGMHPGSATVRFAIGPALPVTDPAPSNNSVTVQVKVLAATKVFTELRNPVWSQDGKTIAYVRWSEPGQRHPYPTLATSGQVWVARADGSHRHPVTPQMPVPRSLSWAPDGHAILFTSGAVGDLLPTLWAVDVHTRAPVNLGRGRYNPGWSPDGTRIAYATEGTHGGEFDVISSSGGASTYVAFDGGTPGQEARPLVWSPDSRYLLLGNQLAATDGSGAVLETDAVAWSRDGSLKLTGNNEIVAVATGRVLASIPSLIRPQLAPDGHAVAGTKLDGRVGIASVAAAKVVYAPEAQSANDTVSWSPKHQLAYVGSGPCGPRSQIDTVQSNGRGKRVIARSC